ncbi:hypothetical protein L3X38_039296 [Prunus dulcis]|uniref:Uncharacterized protein n=1 Tax=Prunus dulcis TaxID=3755 RepID=A0AAD4V7Z5_PRUDU|nr:hypothetical protein L3X38_039296 [Prunus dulcis]
MAAAGLKSFCRRRLTFLYKKFHLVRCRGQMGRPCPFPNLIPSLLLSSLNSPSLGMRFALQTAQQNYNVG